MAALAREPTPLYDPRDPRGFAALYRTRAPQVERYLQRALGNEEDAEDATSQVFLKAWRWLEQADEPLADPVAWLFTLARTTAIDFRRRTRPVALLDPEALQAAVDRGVADAEPPRLDWISRAEVRQGLARLPRRQHEAIVCRYLLGLSHAETARVLGSSEGAVRKAHHLGLRALARQLEPAGEERRRSHAMRQLLLPRRLLRGGFTLLPPRLRWAGRH